MIDSVKHSYVYDNRTAHLATAIKKLQGARKNHYSERKDEETRYDITHGSRPRRDAKMSGGCVGNRLNLVGSEISISTHSSGRTGSTEPCGLTATCYEERSWIIKPILKSKKKKKNMYGAPIVKRKELEARKPFCSVVRKVLNSSQTAATTVDRKFCYNPDIFYQLHEDSSWKYKEGRERRESIRAVSEERARWRNGAYRETRQISAEHGMRLYYDGMMHKVHKERRVAEKAANLGNPHMTKLNLQQMIEYCFKMQQDEMKAFIHNL